MERTVSLGVGLVFILLIILGIWSFKKNSQFNIIDRLVVSLTPSMVFLLIGIISMNLLDLPYNNWNHNRLTPTFALIYGYKNFNDFDSGPCLSWMYGPLAALAYLPATLTKSPTVAIIIAGFLSVLFFLLPLILIVLKSLNNLDNISKISWTITIILIAFLVSEKTRGLNFMYQIHSDAPSLCLAGLSCVALYYRNSKNDKLLLGMSSTLAVLAIWTKQNLIFLPFALLTYIILNYGRKVFLKYAFYFFVNMLVISTILVFIFGAEYIYFTMVKLPSSYSLVGQFSPGIYDEPSLLLKGWQLPTRITFLFLAFYEMFLLIFPLLLIFTFFLIINKFNVGLKINLRYLLTKNSWSIFLLVGIFGLPIALVSRLKFGGYYNSYAISFYFILCMTTAIISECYNNSLDLENLKIAKFSVLILAVTLAIITPSSLTDRIKNITTSTIDSFNERNKTPVELAYQYTLKHPEQIYFPQFPLATLMADGKLYHSYFGLWDRDHADRNYFKLSRKHFQQYLPSHLKQVIFFEGTPANKEIVMHYLPKFSQANISIPGWVIFTQK